MFLKLYVNEFVKGKKQTKTICFIKFLETLHINYEILAALIVKLTPTIGGPRWVVTRFVGNVNKLFKFNLSLIFF